MRLLDGDLLASFLSPLFGEPLFDVLPKLAGRIAGNIQQLDRAGRFVDCLLVGRRDRQRSAASRR